MITGTVGTELSQSLTPEQYGLMYLISIADKSVELIETTAKMGNIDGIAEFDGGLLASSPMTGKLFFIKDGKSTELLAGAPGMADIGIDAQNDIVYAPFLFGNKVITYQLKASKQASK